MIKHDVTLETSDNTWWKWWFLPFGIWSLTVGICYSLGANDPSYDEDGSTDKDLFWLWAMIAVGNLGMITTLLLIAFLSKRTVPLFTDRAFFRGHLVIFVVAMVLFSVVSAGIFTPGTRCHPYMKVTKDEGDKGEFDKGVFYNDGTNRSLATPYTACRIQWGSPSHPVRILDLAAMSWYAYDNNEADYQRLLDTSFKNATSVHWDDRGKLPRIVAARLCGSAQGDGSEECTIIVAVRGTSSKLEIMSDIGIFTTVAVMQTLDKIAPMFGTLPVHLLGRVLNFFRFSFLRNTQHKILTRVEEVIDGLKNKYTKDTLVLTGHSLGGNFAEVTGARLRIPAVGFSAPGQFYLMEGFGTNRQSITKNILTIQPSMDVVPWVGGHVDVVQRINCIDANGNTRAYHECHSPENAACELWRVCGDVEKRSFNCLENGAVHEDCVGSDFALDQSNARCTRKQDHSIDPF